MADLSVIDSILVNLESVKDLYEYEYKELSDFLSNLQQYKAAKLIIPQLSGHNGDLFQKEANADLKFYATRLNDLKQKIATLEKEIASRRESKEKLVKLFDSLQSLDAIEAAGGLSSTKATTEAGDAEAVDSEAGNEVQGGLPIMNIREELDEDGNVINSEVKPYDTSKNELFNKAFEKKQAKGTAEAKTIKDGDDTHPYATKEEVDEDGNIIKSSVKVRKKIQGEPETEPELKQEPVASASPESDDDQLSELLEDMDLKKPHIEELTEDEEEKEEEKEEEVTETAEEPKVVPVTEEPKEEDDGNETVQTIDKSMYSAEIDPQDLLTLEMISNEVDGHAEDDEDAEDEEGYNYEEGDYDNNDDDDDDDEDLDIGMVPSAAQALLAQQILRLREGNNPTKVSEHKEEVKVKEKSKKDKKPKKDKKAVSFADSVDVKEVDDIWDDLRESEKGAGKVSRFRRMMDSDQHHQEKTIAKGMVIGDIMEHAVSEEHEDASAKLVAPASVIDEPTGMTKLGKKKQPSRFQMARAAQAGKQYQQSRGNTGNIPAFAKKKMSSLTPPKVHARPTRIEVPKDPNPSRGESLREEDFQAVRDEEQSTHNENDELTEEYELVDRTEELEKVKKEMDKLHVKKVSLEGDASADTMAKAYVMGLYDDDAETEELDGPVIEKLEDFKKHNESVEIYDKWHQEDKITELDDKEDDAPLMRKSIVEHDDDSEPDEEYEMTTDNLNAQVALDYARMRDRMVKTYKGGYREENDPEFEPVEPQPKVSRFKAARLGMK